MRFGGTRHVTAAQRAAFRADLRYWHTAIVVLSPYAPHYDQLRNALNQLTGPAGRFKGYSSGTWVNELRACPRAISYRAALCGDQGTAHTAACGR